MATLTLRRLDPETKARLRVRAALASQNAKGVNLAEFIRSRVEPLGGVELPEVVREPMREPPDFTR